MEHKLQGVSIVTMKLPWAYNAGKSWTRNKTILFNAFYKSLSVYPEGEFKVNPDLRFIEQLYGLKELFLYYNTKIDLRPIESAKQLTFVDFGGSKSAYPLNLSGIELQSAVFSDQKELYSLYSNPHLEVLKIASYTKSDLGMLSNMKSLKKLVIFSSKNLTSLHGIENLDKLTLIEIERCPNLTDISAYSNIDRKIKLRINGELIYRVRDLESHEIDSIKQKFGKHRIDIHFK